MAIVARADDEKTISMLKKIEDEHSRLEIEAERALSNFVESGCRFPVGAYAKTDEKNTAQALAAKKLPANAKNTPKPKCF